MKLTSSEDPSLHDTPTAHFRQRAIVMNAFRRLARGHPGVSLLQLALLLAESPRHQRLLKALRNRRAGVTTPG